MVMDPNDTERTVDKQDKCSNMDNNNINTTPEVISTEVIGLLNRYNGVTEENSNSPSMDNIDTSGVTSEKELPNNNDEKYQDNSDNNSIMRSSINSLPKETSVKVIEPSSHKNKKIANNNSIMVNNINTLSELTSMEVMKPPNHNDNDKIQVNSGHTAFVVTDNEIDVTITGVIEPPKINNQKPVENSENSSSMDIETTIEVTKIEVEAPPNDNNDTHVDNSNSKDVDTTIETREMEVMGPPSNNEETRGNSDNSSNMKLEHMMSLKVVLERAKYYGCNNCNLVFFRPCDVKLHALKHLLPSRKESDEDDRFVKRFKCDECGLRFVQLSTLEAHAAVHAPFPHICHCGIGYYRLKDLNSHKNLVHLAEIRDQLSGLTDRQQKAFKNEIWEPNVVYTVVKKEPKAGPKPRLKAELTTKPKPGRKKALIERYRCEEEKLIIKNEDKTFTCPICFKKYKSKAGVQVHLGSHAKVKPYACDLCDTRFTQVAALKTHKRLHTGVKEFRCGFCGKEFFSEHNMKNHVRTHTGEKPFKCSFCSKAFSDQSAHQRHERTHTGLKPYSCSFCEMKFSDASGLIAHKRRHNSTKNVKCTECHKMFWTKDYLRKHMTAVHGYDKNHECKLCNKSFALKSYLYMHMKLHVQNKRFECDYCGFRTRLKASLMKHIETIHLHIRNRKCPECAMRFSTDKELKNHYANVHSRPLNYECDICGERQSIKSLIGKHILEKHSEVKCKTCLKQFANSADLQKHAEQGCLRCQCGKYFPTKGTMKTHQIAHDAKRPHLCDYCDKRFKTKSRLRKHHETVHENTKKFECDECGKQFSVRHHLQTHIYSFHLTYVYCHLCRGRFLSESALKEHKAKRNCINEHQCVICGKVCAAKSQLINHLRLHEDMKFHCAHCSRQFKYRNSMKRHLKLCHKDIFFTKSNSSKAYRRRTMSGRTF